METVVATKARAKAVIRQGEHWQELYVAKRCGIYEDEDKDTLWVYTASAFGVVDVEEENIDDFRFHITVKDRGVPTAFFYVSEIEYKS